MMISTLLPVGAINETEVAFLNSVGKDGFYYLVDNNSNQWRISESDYLLLKNKGFQTKEVRYK